MDVHCTTCGEPWDTHRLRHDAIWETGMSDAEIADWECLTREEKLRPGFRDEFESIGFRFGQSLLNVIHCPCCPKGAAPNEEVMFLKGELETILGNDEDGLASTFEEFGL